MLGVVTGIPMEFQFGTNWAHFSQFAGGVIGQTLAMEGVFAFFLESTFLGLFLFGEKRLSAGAALVRGVHGVSSDRGCRATSSSPPTPGCSIRSATTAWRDGSVQLQSFWALLLNPWALWQYAHNMSGAAITGAFVMAAVGAFYLLSGKHAGAGADLHPHRRDCRLHLSACCRLFPTGDAQGRMVAKHQPATLAAMEGLFTTQIGRAAGHHRPAERRAAEASTIRSSFRSMLSFLTYGRLERRGEGPGRFPAETSGPTTSRCSITAITSWSGWGRSSSPSWCCRAVAAVAQEAVRRALDAVDPDAQRLRFPTSPTPPDG